MIITIKLDEADACALSEEIKSWDGSEIGAYVSETMMKYIGQFCEQLPAEGLRRIWREGMVLDEDEMLADVLDDQGICWAREIVKKH